MNDRPLSTSPDRGKFGLQRYLERLEQDPDDLDAAKMLRMFEHDMDSRRQHESDAAWQEHNLEYDMRSTEWFVAKCQDDNYAQNIYAAICNNTFRKREVIAILREDTWSASWRSAGGIVADLQGRGDYIDWYCTGIGEKTGEFSKFVGESYVTDEVRADLDKLGWIVLDDNDDS